MSKGFFTQGACILFDRADVSVDEILAALKGFKITKRIDTPRSGYLAAPGCIIAYRPNINGYVVVDFINEPWPDDMGDPKQMPELFAAWSMGHLGPMTFPSNLKRATQLCWNWKDAKNEVPKHRAFIRLLCTYALGAKEDAPIWPKEVDAMDELQFMTKVASALLAIQGAICYFNPGGETLYPLAGLQSVLEQSQERDIPEFNLWTNVRTMNPDCEGWFLMDTVGMEQLDLPDLEACFLHAHFEMSDVAMFLRNTSLYLIKNGEVIRDSETIDGAGGMNWRAFSVENGIASPPRRVLRWFPTDESDPPEMFRPA